MNHMTYGYLPPYRDFEEAFDSQHLTDSLYPIYLNTSDSLACNGFKLGTGLWQCQELYPALEEIVSHWATDTSFDAGPYQDVRVDLVSSILETLGFEWV